ncbi:hypothetical protein JXJ21_13050 [candidate division KSB1 bacterium]|nr:hypothetical protein [candidate division KSB1 bacterium]
MRNKILFIIIALLQIGILAFFIHSKSSVTASETKITLQPRMIELQRFTANNRISLTYPINSISSIDMAYESANYQINHSVYLKLKQKDDVWSPVYFSASMPELAEGEILVKGQISDIEKENQYSFSYKKDGRALQGKWMGNIRKVKKDDQALLALDRAHPEIIKTATNYMVYENRGSGRLLDVQPVPGKKLSFLLKVSFEDNGKTITGQFQYANDSAKPIPPVGSPVSVSFIKEQKGYQVMYVELEPLTEAQITDISKGYKLAITFGIEYFLLQPEQKHALNELIDKYGDTDVSVEAAVHPSGELALTAIFIGKEKVAL